MLGRMVLIGAAEFSAFLLLTGAVAGWAVALAPIH